MLLKFNTSKNNEEISVSENPEEIDTSMNPEEIDVCENIVEIYTTKAREGIELSKTHVETDAYKKPEQIETSVNPGEIDTSNVLEEIDVQKKLEDADDSMNNVETDISKKPEETVLETSCDQTITVVAEAISSEQNPHRMTANRDQSHENVRTSENDEEIVVPKKPEVINTSKKRKQTDIVSKPQEIDILKKHKQTNTSMNTEETDTLKTHEETGTCKLAKERDTSKKSVVSELESLCQSMDAKKMKWHVATYLSEMVNLKGEIAKALKLAEDPANLVLNSIGRFFTHRSRTFCEDLGPHHIKQNAGRRASVLILECFVMINSDNDIETAKGDHVRAAEDAVIWRQWMIEEGRFRSVEEVDARGLLLLISGFGIQDHVFTLPKKIKDHIFKILDVMDLIRASNVKGIFVALRRSVFLQKFQR